MRDLFEADLTKLALSIVIIISLLPPSAFPQAATLSPVFFGIFALEFLLRVLVLRFELRHRRLNRAEVVALALDGIATLSFLPLERLVGARYLRLLRLSRMLMLISYWSAVVREVWFILSKRERRYQLVFIASLAIILTFSSAILLSHIAVQRGMETATADFDEDGQLTVADRSFPTVLWWTFRQIQDPGNLLKAPSATLTFVFSVGLTLAGIFIVAFVIGIGTSVVEELVRLGKKRRLGLRKHSVIANLGRNSRVLVEELINYYAKTLRSPRLVTLGTAEERYEYMYAERLRAIRYRHGQASSEHDLRRVDADRARRVILLGDYAHDNPDATLVSQVLAVRQQSRCWIYAEVANPNNIEATLTAGANRTVAVPAQQLVSHLLVELIATPQLAALYEQLLSSKGDEIYSVLYGQGQLEEETPPSGFLPPIDGLRRWARRQFGVLLLGVVVDSPRRELGFEHSFRLSGQTPLQDEGLRGFFGIAPSFDQMKAFARGLPEIAAAANSATRQTPTEIGHATSAAVSVEEASCQNLLFCGWHPYMSEFFRQAARLTVDLSLRCLVPDASCAQQLINELCANHDLNPQRQAETVRFVVQDPCSLAIEVGGQHRGTLTVLTGDWSNDQVLLREDVRVWDADAVVLSWTGSAEDPDARTALTLIKLIHMQQARRTPTEKSLRIICELLSPEKANLLRERYAGGTSSSCAGVNSCPTVTIVANERSRNEFVAQGVFVPGAVAIYRELLGRCGHRLRFATLPSIPSEERWISFDQLADHLALNGGDLLVAVLRQPDGRLPEVVVNPPAGAAAFERSTLRGVYLLQSPIAAES